MKTENEIARTPVLTKFQSMMVVGIVIYVIYKYNIK